jgi:hypothetical protein
VLRGVAADVIPWRLRSNEDVHLDLNARIAINCTESNSVYFALVHSTECGAAGPAEAQTPSRRRLVLRQVLLTTNPRERAGYDFRVSRTGAAECLSAP